VSLRRDVVTLFTPARLRCVPAPAPAPAPAAAPVNSSPRTRADTNDRTGNANDATRRSFIYITNVSLLVSAEFIRSYGRSQSAALSALSPRTVKLSTVGGRAFPVAGPTIWNSLPDNVISAPSQSTFRQRLKHFCSTPRSLTLSTIPGKLFPTSSGS